MLEIQSRSTGFSTFDVSYTYAKISSPSRPESQALTTRSTSSRLRRLVDDLELLLRPVVARLQLEVVRHDRKIGHPPPLEARVVLLGLGKRHEVPDRPGDRRTRPTRGTPRVFSNVPEAPPAMSRPTEGFSAMMSVLPIAEHHSEEAGAVDASAPDTLPDVSLFYRFAAFVSRPVVKWLYRLEVRGLEHVPKAGGFVVAANHTSNLDPWPLGHRARAAASCISWPSRSSGNPGCARCSAGLRRVPGAARRGRRGGVWRPPSGCASEGG